MNGQILSTESRNTFLVLIQVVSNDVVTTGTLDNLKQLVVSC